MSKNSNLKLWNSLTHQLEPFRAGQADEVRMYSCGPTVYGRAHIGNLRSFVVADTLRRVLEWFGYSVDQVMNITDIDDKIIRNAAEAKQSRAEFIKPHVAEFLADLKALNIETPTVIRPATEVIPEMIQLISALLEAGIAYQTEDGSVYFAIKKFPAYGRLSQLDQRQLKAGASGRVIADEYDKQSVADFALWKAWTEVDGDNVWEAPFGKGRPGWHIECSAIVLKELTAVFATGQFKPEQFKTIDLHTGGIDLLFPHHENEVAQVEPLTNKPFARFFVHNEHLLIDGQKMAKSLGNVYSLADVLAHQAAPLDYRFLLLQAHYRQKLNFKWQSLASARSARLDLVRFVDEQRHGHDKLSAQSQQLIDSARDRIESALADDLNIAEALAVLSELRHSINKQAIRAKAVADFFEQWEQVFAIGLTEPFYVDADERADHLFTDYLSAKAQQDYHQSDLLREELLMLGFAVEDLAGGSSKLYKK